MTGDRLTLDFDEDDRAVWLTVTSTAGIQQRHAIWLRAGFGIDEVREAVLATGWVRHDAGELRLTGDMRCEPLRNVVDEMLGYFKEPGTPRGELLEVQSAVAEYDFMSQSSVVIPLYAYAWLDIMVRDDIADEARTAKRVWRDSKVVIDLARYCDRRVEELAARYSQQPATSAIGRMAGSIPTRSAEEKRGAKTG